ncbi:MAG: HAD family phosphatase [Deltaproteobacteria bacterium]|nr:HAD family phosphatase [Deltaproteobacteria bacterium]
MERIIFVKNNIKGIIFDFDGVIVDSEPFWDRVDEMIIEQEGVRFIPEIKNRVMGLAPLLSVIELCRVHNIKTPPEILLKRREDLMKKFYETAIELNYGAYETLEYLHNKGLKLALASSTPKRLFESALKRFNIDRFFDVIVTSEDVESSKPNPEIFIRAQELLSLPKSELIIVEDSRAGIEAAIASGIEVIWLKNVSTDIKDLSPDYIINSLSDIRLCFEKKS